MGGGIAGPGSGTGAAGAVGGAGDGGGFGGEDVGPYAEQYENTVISSGGSNFRISAHAATRMIERGVSPADVQGAIDNGPAVDYMQSLKGGGTAPTTGYVDSQSRVFVAVRERTIVTVVKNYGKNYPTNLLTRK